MITERQTEYIDGLIRYVQTHPSWNRWSPDQAISNTLQVMFNNIGAAQGFLDALGIDVDLYDSIPKGFLPPDPRERFIYCPSGWMRNKQGKIFLSSPAMKWGVIHAAK